jgi:hypothetical protein
MPNYDDSTAAMIADHILGLRVDRAISVLPQHGGVDGVTYFNIVGGKILLTLLVGTITTVIEAAANEVVFSHNPDPSTGATAALNGALDITGWAEGDILTINGLLTDALLPAVKAGSSHAMSYGGVILVPGAITCDCSGHNTGGWKWSLWYFPLEEGAYVAAA